MVMALLFLRLELLVKVASSILIVLFVFANLTVILFRESKISSYRPKFQSPFYPYMQIVGIFGGGFLLIEMGTLIVFLTMTFLLLGFIWYKVYAQKRAVRDSALIYVLERLVAKDKELVSDNLLTELKDIVIQRDELIKDKFHKLIEQSKILDIEGVINAEDFFQEATALLGKELNLEPEILFEKFIKREKESSTVIKKGLAIPHIIVEGKNISNVLLVRAREGIVFPRDEVVHILFVLVGCGADRVLHLKILAAIAQIVQHPEFDKKWLEARNQDELRNIILLAERRRG
jgi:mannitol/fructose-specific phosphotransferase system IIA component (Ntr-type)